MKIAVFSDKFPPAWGGGVASVHYHLLRWLAHQPGVDARGFAFFDDSPNGDPPWVAQRRSCPQGLLRTMKRVNNLVFRLADGGKAAYQTLDIAIRAWGARQLNDAVAAFAPDLAIFPDHGVPGYWIATPRHCQRILTPHHNPSRFIGLPGIDPLSEKDIRLAMAIERRAVRTMHKVIAPCQFMKGLFHETHAFKGETAIGPYILNQDYFDAIAPADPREQLGLPPDAPLIYLPQGGNKFKGANVVVDLVAALDKAAGGKVGFFISGAVTRDFLARLAPAKVHAPGMQRGDGVVATVKRCSFGVFPTLVENYSVAMLEAVLCGVPMVTFNVGGNAEIVRDGDTGYVVDYLDGRAMFHRALQLMDATHQATMVARCLNDARKRHSESALAPLWRRELNLPG